MGSESHQSRLGQVIGLRVRHLTDGVFPGPKEFVNEILARHRDHFGVPLPGIRVMRDLRVDAIGWAMNRVRAVSKG